MDKKRFMLALVMTVVLLALGAIGCTGPITLYEKFDYDGLTRNYVVEMPRDYDGTRSVPLLVVLHGAGQTPDAIRNVTQFGRLVEELGFLVVYPEAIGLNWNDGRDVPGFPAYDLDVDDVGFIGAVIKRVAASFAIDPRRVYATGMSNGALMTHRLAWEAPELFAAAAPVMGAIPENLLALPPPGASMPMLIMDGTADDVVPWEGGDVYYEGMFIGTLVSVPDSVAFWVAHNHCIEPPEVVALEDVDPQDGTRVYREYYLPGPEDAEVVFYRIEGGGHTWPGEDYNGSLSSVTTGVSQDIDASRVVWEFCSQYQREQP